MLISKKRVKNRYIKILIFVMIIYFLVFGLLSSLSHYSLNSGRDMKLTQESLYNTFNGEFLYVEYFNSNRLSDHFFLTMIFILPIYYLLPSAYTLLFLQTFAITIGAIIIFFLAEDKLKSKKLSLFISLTYLLSLNLASLQFQEVRMISFGIPLFLFALLFLEKENYVLFTIFLILTASVKETMFLIIIPFSFYVYTKDKNIGIRVFLSSTLAFLLIIFIIMPNIGNAEDRSYRHFSKYSYIGEDSIEITKNVLENPDIILKLESGESKRVPEYLFNTIKFNHFIPILSPFSLIAVPTLMINIASDSVFQQYALGYHTTKLTPIFFFSIILVLSKLKCVLTKRFLEILAISIFIFSFLYFLIYGIPSIKLEIQDCSTKDYIPTIYSEIRCYNNTLKDYKDIHQYINSIPKNATLRATFRFQAYFPERGVIRWWPSNPDYDSKYLLIDVKDFELNDPLIKEANKEILSSGYKIDYQKNNIYLYSK